MPRIEFEFYQPEVELPDMAKPAVPVEEPIRREVPAIPHPIPDRQPAEPVPAPTPAPATEPIITPSREPVPAVR